jgi:dipeptidase E
MQNTNDMPIIYPPSFQTLGLIPFNINAHYLIPIRKPSIWEKPRNQNKRVSFNTIPVLGLREGSWLEVKGETVILKGTLQARLLIKIKWLLK